MTTRQRFSFRPPPQQPGGIPAYFWAPAAATATAVVYGYYAYLDEAPLTKRRRWIATSPQWEQKIGDQEYRKLLRQYRGKILPKEHRATQTVHRVGSRIAFASQEFCREHELGSVSKSPYTYTVVRSDIANAFVLPGNHVFVLTGLFQYVRNEDELAAVLGHETAHNLARHAGERLSGGILENVMATVLFMVDPSGALSSIFLSSASLIHDLPHSRAAESEADRIGIELAAKACYDPRAAKQVFAAMKEGSTVDGSTRAPPEFMSTHPSHDRRIAQFDEWLPDAMNTYHKDDFGETCRRVRRDMAAARQVAALQAAEREERTRRT